MFTCTQCKQRFNGVPVLLKGSTWYFIFDHDSSQFTHNPGHKNECKRELWEWTRERRDKYSKVYGKIFPCWFAYCSEACVKK